MLGIFLIFLAMSFRETGVVIGKDAVKDHTQSLYANTFLAIFFATIFFGIILIFSRDTIVFDVASLPTLLTRLFLEIAILLAVTKAVILADRTTISFFRTLSIPLLLGLDLILGYHVSTLQFAGIFVILTLLFASYYRQTISRKGLFFVILAALLGVCTTTLYKYNIENYNSVAVEQFVVVTGMLLAAIAMVQYVSRESIFSLLGNKRFFVQSLLMGMSSIFVSYGFALLNPAIAMAVKRSLGVILATFTGLRHYDEGHKHAKILLVCGMICGIVLLAL